MKQCYLTVVFIALLFANRLQAQTANAVGTVTNVTCYGDSTGSIVYNIYGGTGPVHYVWNTGDSGVTTGGCTYAVHLNNPGGPLSQFQVRVNVTLATGMNPNFSNVSFIDALGNPIPFWLKDFPTATNAVFWVRVPNVPAGLSDIYMTFCSSSTTSLSNPNTTFEFFEDFELGLLATWYPTCEGINQTGEYCSSLVDNSSVYAGAYSAHLSAVSSCFSAPYDGAGGNIKKKVVLGTDSMIVDYNDKASVELAGFCSGGTGTAITCLVNGFSANGQSVFQGGSCAVNAGAWQDDSSVPFAPTGNDTIELRSYGGDCDNSNGWFDDVRVRKYVYNPPVATIDTSPQLVLDSLPAGTYTITMTDPSGNVTTNSFTVTQPPQLILNADSSNTACPGASNGSAWVDIVGGSPSYVITWAGGQYTDTLHNLTTGSYAVTVTDANGCSAATSTQVVASPLSLVLAADSVDVGCYGAHDGQAWVAVTGGQTPYTYNWSNSQHTDTITGLAPGTFTVTVSDIYGCSTTASVDVHQPPSSLTTFAAFSQVKCKGDSTGKAWALAFGGYTPYSYLWSNGGITDTITVPAGTYSVTVTDAGGCTKTASVTVTEPATAISATGGTSPVACQGSSSGTAWVVASGGTPNYTYQWPNSSTNDTIYNVAAGTYTVTVSDSRGCSVTVGDTVGTSSTSISLGFTHQDAACANATNGKARVTVTGGVAPFQYLWSNSITTDSIVHVTAGTYAVTVTDNNGCTAVDSVTINNGTTSINLNTLATNVSCNGAHTGKAWVTAAGGAAPYQYTWSNSITSDTISNQAAGNYDVTVADVNGCSATTSVVINEPTAITLTTGSSAILCLGNNQGRAWIGATGGVAPYQYLWSTGDVTDTINNLPPGSYNVEMVDNNGCRETATVIVNGASQVLTLTTDSTDVSCRGGNNGVARVTVSGGTPAYTYAWAGGQQADSATGLIAGTYAVTVTDANGCNNSTTVTVNQPITSISATASSSPAQCVGSNTGSAWVTVTNGNPTYTYQWTNSGSTDTIQNIATGNYTVTVTDANGCSTVASTVVTALAGIALDQSSVTPACINDSVGAVTVSFTGGTNPYHYVWNNGDTTQTISNLAGGNYAVTVTDANNCTDTFSVHVPAITYDVNISAIPDTEVLTGESVQLVVDDSNAVNIVWTPSTGLDNTTSSTVTATLDTDAIYHVTVTSADGCTATDSIHIAVLENPVWYFPNAFTPNGDGNNDRFNIIPFGPVEIVFFKIFNRWGDLVFEQKGNLPGWDGTYQGKEAAGGIYVYYGQIRYKKAGSNPKQVYVKGSITLLR